MTVGVFVVRLGDDQFVTWSNTTDSPVSYVMAREELITFLASEEAVPYEQAVHILDVAEERGVSRPDLDLADVLAANRAGDDEDRISVQEIVRRYRR